MKFLLALLIASQAIVLISGQRERTIGTVARDSVVRDTFILNGGPNQTHIIESSRPITGIRGFDLTNAGSSGFEITDGAINQNRITVTGFPTIPGQQFNVRVTAFSSSTLINASAMLMTIVMFFIHYLR